MELKVYDANDVPSTKTVYLKLEDKGDGSIRICACDQEGKQLAAGLLATFMKADNDKFKLHLAYFVGEDNGFVLDEDYRLLTK